MGSKELWHLFKRKTCSGVIGFEDVDWIHLAQDRDRQQAIVSRAVNF
jgi:hypothetical protein